jgi:hypothetical protein
MAKKRFSVKILSVENYLTDFVELCMSDRNIVGAFVVFFFSDSLKHEREGE